MQSELCQDCAMTPELRPAVSGGVTDTSTLLRSLAAATDWPSLCAELETRLAALLPATRLDIYASMPGGEIARRFTTDLDRFTLPRADTEVQLRYQLQVDGYEAIAIVPLIALGERCGWLVLARRAGRLPLSAQALAEQIAPPLALWLRSEQYSQALAASAERVALLEQRVRATDTLRLRATLIAGAAHDIGNLFTTMMGYTQILQQDLPAPFQDDIRMIMRAVEDGRQLLRRLGGHDSTIAPALAALPIGHIVEEVVKLTRPLWERRAGLKVHTRIEHVASICMSSEDLREVLVNLIMNAIAAVPEQGQITISSHVVGDNAIISVSDTGQGIAREYHSTIFQPFVTTRVDGTGLGLSISRALVEGSGGTLTVDSEPGQGATFTIRLPVRP